jgi:hypothetical protein
MIDLRPKAAGWPVEIIDGEKRIKVGRLDDRGRKNIDEITDKAVAEAVRRGWFEVDQKDTFDFIYYWDSVDGMRKYVEEEWAPNTTIPGEVLSEAHRLAKSAGDGIQVGVRRALMIASYRRLAAGGKSKPHERP